jgi:hypothetical protein
MINANAITVLLFKAIIGSLASRYALRGKRVSDVPQRGNQIELKDKKLM